MDKSYIKEPGIYNVLIIGAEATQSKKLDPMLVITFKQIGGNGGEIRGYYVPKHKFMAEALASLKLACGLPPTAKKEDLLGKKIQIVVELQKVIPGKERINEKTGLPYPPSSQVVAYKPFQDEPTPEDEGILPF